MTYKKVTQRHRQTQITGKKTQVTYPNGLQPKWPTKNLDNDTDRHRQTQNKDKNTDTDKNKDKDKTQRQREKKTQTKKDIVEKSERRIYKNCIYISIKQQDTSYLPTTIMYNKLPATKINKQTDTEKEIDKVTDKKDDR